MLNVKRIKKSIKKNYGKKGLCFTEDVGKSLFSAKNGSGIFNNLRKGIQEQKQIDEERREALEISEFRELLKSGVSTLSAIPYVVLILKGVLEKGGERVCEIAISIEPELEKINNEIDSGLYDCIRDEPSELMDHLFINRLILAANLSQYEMTYVKGITSLEFENMIKKLDEEAE